MVGNGLACGGDGGWRHTRIDLEPDSRAFVPIIVPAQDAEASRILAESLGGLSQPG